MRSLRSSFVRSVEPRQDPVRCFGHFRCAHAAMPESPVREALEVDENYLLHLKVTYILAQGREAGPGNSDREVTGVNA